MDYSPIIRRSSLGQRYTPDELLLKFQEYIGHMNSTGLIWVYERVTYKGSSDLVAVPKRAPLTVKSFCLYALMSENVFAEYLNPNSAYFLDYNDVATYIVNACQVDYANGAAVGIYNGNLASQYTNSAQKLLGEDTDSEKRGKHEINRIEHNVRFLNFSRIATDTVIDDNTCETQDFPSDIDTPIDVNELVAEAERLQGDKAARPLGKGDYDNKENTSSRNDNMYEYNTRNNVTQDDSEE